MLSDVTHIYKGRHPITQFPFHSLPSALQSRNSLRVVRRKCSKEQIYKYLLWLNIGCWPKENNRMGGCYPGLRACHLKRQNIDKGDLRKPHVISAFGFISVCCLRRSAQIQTANITVPFCRDQSQSHSSQARKNMNTYK